MPEIAKTPRLGPLFAWTLVTGVIGWFPVASIIACSVIAQIGHCQVNEGGPQPCYVAGRDMGETAYELGVLGWCFLITFPLALISIVLSVLLIVRAFRRRRDAGSHK
jgi:hypothetical protein